MKGGCLQLEKPIQDAVSRIRFAPNSNNLLISSWDSCLRLYDVDSSLLRLQASSPAPLLDCCFHTHSVAFCAASDGCISRYDLDSETTNAVGTHHDTATCVAYSDQTCQVVSGGLDKKIIAWDMRTAKAHTHMKNVDAEVESMSVSGFDLMVAIGTSVITYDLRNLERSVHLKELYPDVRIRCISSIPYSRGYAVGSVDGRVAFEILGSLNMNGSGYTFRCHPKSKDGRGHLVSVNDIVFNPLICGAFATGDNEGYVIAWDAQSKRRLYELPKYPNSVASLSYNHNGQILAVASSYTYQEGNEMEEPPQIFIQETDGGNIGSSSARGSCRQ